MEVTTRSRHRALAALAADRINSDSRKLVDFALFLLEQGVESDNVYILAGLQNDSWHEKMQYFRLVLNDLGVTEPNEKELDPMYVQSIAEQVLAGEVDPVVGVRQLERMHTRPNPNHFYFVFLEISDGLDLLDEYELVTGMTPENHKTYINHTFELYLKFLDLEVPTDFYQQGYCKKCGTRSRPIHKKKSVGFFRTGSYSTRTCGHCGGVDFVWTRYNAGKDMYLQEIGLATN